MRVGQDTMAEGAEPDNPEVEVADNPEVEAADNPEVEAADNPEVEAADIPEVEAADTLVLAADTLVLAADTQVLGAAHKQVQADLRTYKRMLYLQALVPYIETMLSGSTILFSRFYFFANSASYPKFTKFT